MPMHTAIEAMPNVPDCVAILHGPIVLAARTGTEDLRGLTLTLPDPSGATPILLHFQLVPAGTFLSILNVSVSTSATWPSSGIVTNMRF